jgi:hypothetical protein
LPERGKRGRQHAVDDRDVGAQLVDRVAGVEGDLRPGIVAIMRSTCASKATETSGSRLRR